MSVEYSGDPGHPCPARGRSAADAGLGCRPRYGRRPAQRGAGRGQANRGRARSAAERHVRRAHLAAAATADRGPACPFGRRHRAGGARDVRRGGPVPAVCAAGRVPPGGDRLAVLFLAPRTDRSGSAACWDRRPRAAGGTMTGGGAVEHFRRVVESAVRGAAGVVVTVALFAAAAAVGGRGGVAIASAWVAVAGSYCLANFWHCRETHCAVTGPGWMLAAVLGFAAALAPGTALSWYRVNVETLVFVVILAAGYGLEYLVAARTGRRVLGQEGQHAQNR